MTKLTELTNELSQTPDDGDLVHVVDVSDTSGSTAGTSKRSTVANLLSGKQDALVSGTSIKTINGESVLGGGDIVISPGTDAPVDSVNGETGAVVLDSGDIAEGSNLYYTEARVSANSAVALNTAKNTYPPADATKLSGIQDNANNYVLPTNVVQDASYVHTDNNFTNAISAKLAGIEAGAEVNVQADWDATSGDAQILNKPEIGIKYPAPSIRGMSPDNTALYVRNRTTGPTAIYMAEDGMNLYLCSNSPDRIIHYSLSVAHELTSATFTSFMDSAEEGFLKGIYFHPNGLTMFTTGGITDAVYEYTLTTAWDLSTATYTGNSISVLANVPNIEELSFKADGTVMYIFDATSDRLKEFDMSVPWDITTAVFARESAPLGEQDASPLSVELSADGTKLYVVGNQVDVLLQYSLSPAFDTSSATFDGIFVSLPTKSNTSSMSFSDGGNSVYFLNGSLDYIERFSIT